MQLLKALRSLFRVEKTNTELVLSRQSFNIREKRIDGSLDHVYARYIPKM